VLSKVRVGMRRWRMRIYQVIESFPDGKWFTVISRVPEDNYGVVTARFHVGDFDANSTDQDIETGG